MKYLSRDTIPNELLIILLGCALLSFSYSCDNKNEIKVDTRSQTVKKSNDIKPSYSPAGSDNGFSLCKNNIDEEISNNPKHKKLLVILVHGLASYRKIDMDMREYHDLKDHLTTNLRDKDINFEIIRIPKHVDKPLGQWSREIDKIISDKHKDVLKGGDRKLILIGHSAGSIVSYMFMRESKHKYNHLALISICGVWRGVEYLSKKPLTRMGKLIYKTTTLTYGLKEPYAFSQLRPGSECINQIKYELDRENPDVGFDIYTISGANSFSKVFWESKFISSFFNIENINEYLMGSDLNDVLVTLESQRGYPICRSYCLSGSIVHTRHLKKGFIDLIEKIMDTRLVKSMGVFSQEEIKTMKCIYDTIPARESPETKMVIVKILRSYLE